MPEPPAEHLVPTRQALEVTAGVLEAAGLSGEHARLVADVLVDAERRGVRSHGLVRLPVYAGRLERGGANPRPLPKLEVDSEGVAVVDGDGGLGPIAADHALLLAVERARRRGTAAVGVRRSGHMGTVGATTREREPASAARSSDSPTRAR